MTDQLKFRLDTSPHYEEMYKDGNEYASFKKNGNWGLLHCATKTVVIPAIYLLALKVSNRGIVRAFLGGDCNYFGESACTVSPKDCHIWVVDGMKSVQVVSSGYDWAEETGPSVVECQIGTKQMSEQKDSFKILKMTDYIAIIKNASYESGFFLRENGKFVKEWSSNCTTYCEQPHAKYISGGFFLAKTYDGKELSVSNEMRKEILRCLRME